MPTDGDVQPRLSNSSRLRGLDGLRGLALIPVLVFHLWPDLLPGGLVGLPIFFALSGFVITRGMLGEISRHRTVELKAFFVRRFRRLWPASALVLALITVVWLFFAWMTRSIAIDVVASFFEVANWRFLLTGTTYGAHEGSPVAHFWSLGIEEQVYLVVPFVVWLLRRRPQRLIGAFSVFIIGSLTFTLANAGNASVVYYSTFTRCAEFFVGALLAVVVDPHPTALRHDRIGRFISAFGFVALAALVWLAFRTSLGTDLYYRGGLTGLALLAAIVIVAAIYSPPMFAVLSIRPLVWIGSISYGVYLIHWPVHIALLHTGLHLWFEPWLVLGISFTVAPISLRLFEEPIRVGRITLRRFAPLGVGLSVLVLVGALYGTSIAAPASEIDFAAAQRRFETAAAHVTPAPPADPNASKGSDANPVSVAIFGDSTAVMLASSVGAGDPRIRDAGGWSRVWCPLGRGGLVRGDSGSGDNPTMPSMPAFDFCDWTTNWPDSIRAAGGVDVALVLTGSWDAAGRQVPSLGDGYHTVGELEYDDWLVGEISGASDALHDAGALHVSWLTLPPKIDRGANPRFEKFTELLQQVASTRPWMTIIDYSSHMANEPNNRKMRPDGSHLDEEGSAELWRTWLNEQVLGIGTGHEATTSPG